MPTGDELSDDPQPPDWALDEAVSDLKGRQAWDVIVQRAQELAREAEERDNRPHDEFDDPDLGGEA